MRHLASMSLNIETETQKTFWNSLSFMKIVVYLFKFIWNVFPLAINNKASKVHIRLAAEQATSHFSNQWWPGLLVEYMRHSTPMNLQGWQAYPISTISIISAHAHSTKGTGSSAGMALVQSVVTETAKYPISQSVSLLNCPVDFSGGVTSRHCIRQRYQNWLNNETHTHVHTNNIHIHVNVLNYYPRDILGQHRKG